MGGHSSGRYRTRNRGAVEQSLRLDMRRLRRLGIVQPGARVSSSLSWSRGDETVGSVGLTVDLTDPDLGHVSLDYSVGGEPRTRHIDLEAVPCRYGGRRFYFRCPRSGQRCELLCCVGGEFASRQHHRLTFSSQSETSLDRLGRAKRKAEARAMGTDGHRRPRGARRERLIERWAHLEAAWVGAFHAETMRRFGKWL